MDSQIIICLSLAVLIIGIKYLKKPSIPIITTPYYIDENGILCKNGNLYKTYSSKS
jgi:hypothetical protein